jgi:predicted AlkP superfamily phosphohydrolase/phosphomutase
VGDQSCDLVAATFSEAHCVGHQFWCFYDETHPLHGARVPERIRSAIPEVYRALDDAIADVVSRASSDVDVLVVASHGMGPYVGGYQLLPAVLQRLGLGLAPSRIAPLRRRYRRLGRRVWRAVLPDRARDWVFNTVDMRASRLDKRGVAAVAVTNNRCGGIRLNLAGREPAGTVRPHEAGAVIGALRHELGALRQPQSGEAIVRSTATPEEAFGPDHHPDLPDLMIAFREDLGPIEECTSERVGTVRVPLWRTETAGVWPFRPRTGDHTGESRAWAKGPSIAARASIVDGDVLDLAPTVLSLLGVPPAAHFDGTPLPLTRDSVGLSPRD